MAAIFRIKLPQIIFENVLKRIVCFKDVLKSIGQF